MLSCKKDKPLNTIFKNFLKGTKDGRTENGMLRDVRSARN